ncbi:MAG: hypothetical protein IJZ55_08030, partial [Lachnospiraceae bacterium]|nr:hypothetical protein [Lachnospiraceae bacterium]
STTNGTQRKTEKVDFVGVLRRMAPNEKLKKSISLGFYDEWHPTRSRKSRFRWGSTTNGTQRKTEKVDFVGLQRRMAPNKKQK